MGCTKNNTSISGTIDFSYFGSPKMGMNVYIKNIRNGEIFSIVTPSNQNKFKVEGIPVGRYVVYAYSKEAEIGEFVLPEKTKLYGGYSEAASYNSEGICNLGEKSKDHKLIEISLKDNQHVTNVVIGDWFAAEVPEE